MVSTSERSRSTDLKLRSAVQLSIFRKSRKAREIDKGRGGKSPRTEQRGRKPFKIARSGAGRKSAEMYIPRASGYIAIAVTIAERIHLFSYRTQKLSSLTPKVLEVTLREDR